MAMEAVHFKMSKLQFPVYYVQYLWDAVNFIKSLHDVKLSQL